MAEQKVTRVAVNSQRRTQLDRWYRWRKGNPTARNRQRAAHYAKGRASAVNARRRWSPEDVCFLLTAVLPDRELARRLGRSVQAVENKRVKLKQKGKS